MAIEYLSFLDVDRVCKTSPPHPGTRWVPALSHHRGEGDRQLPNFLRNLR